MLRISRPSDGNGLGAPGQGGGSGLIGLTHPSSRRDVKSLWPVVCFPGRPYAAPNFAEKWTGEKGGIPAFPSHGIVKRHAGRLWCSLARILMIDAISTAQGDYHQEFSPHDRLLDSCRTRGGSQF